MKINKAELVALLVALGFTKAAEWSNEKLNERIAQIPEKVKPEDVPEAYKGLYEQLASADGKTVVELVDEIDVDTMPVAGLKALVEERKLSIKASVLKDPKALRAAVKKALKSGGLDLPEKPTSKATKKMDKVLDKVSKDKVAKTGKSGKTGGEKTAKPPKEKKVREPKDEKPRDEYGSVIGSIRASVNKTFSDKWKSDDEIAEQAGVHVKQARIRLRRAVKKGVLEIRRRIEYRLVQK